MKASDSVNSLTELTTQSKKECFICLEGDEEGYHPLVDSRILRSCGCKFVVHPDCWNIWMKDKTDFDCPICRRESIKINVRPNPILEFEAHSTERRTSPRCILFLLSVTCIGGALLIMSIVLWGEN